MKSHANPTINVAAYVHTGEKRSRLRVIFDIAKKFIDVIDDIWLIMKNYFPPRIFNVVGPFLTGSIGFIIHFAEAYQGIKEAWLAYRNKNHIIRQKKTRILTGLLVFLFGCTGGGLSLSFVAGGIGAAVSGMTLMPMLIPIFFLCIYTTMLAKRSYIFHSAFKEEKSKQEFSKEHPEAEAHKKQYELAREERLQAERHVALNTIEVLGTTLVLIGTILGLSGIVGAASVASFGLAPLLILVTGVTIGLFCKAFERLDEKHGFVYTRKIRHFAIHCWDQLTFQTKKTFNSSLTKNNSTKKIFSHLGPITVTQTATVIPMTLSYPKITPTLQINKENAAQLVSKPRL